ncbi:MAG: hypothetical protein M1838_000493 [Thelocarpon superellum]|nr:MAG: hypothetical protein M1838_000493 [Thelocarpon superellum]
MICTILLVCLAFATHSTSALSVRRQTTAGTTSPSLDITEAQVLQVSPAANTCTGAPYADECATAAQAAPYITAGFQTYSITTSGEAAALLSLMAFESGDFKYDKNHFPAPGRPGQGTRNMQSAAFNKEYAASIPSLASQFSSLASQGDDDTTENAIRQLVLADQYDFASAAWFLTSQCSSAVRSALQGSSGSEGVALQAWQDYISSCVGTSPTSDRQAYWEKAVTALSSA